METVALSAADKVPLLMVASEAVTLPLSTDKEARFSLPAASMEPPSVTVTAPALTVVSALVTREPAVLATL